MRGFRIRKSVGIFQITGGCGEIPAIIVDADVEKRVQPVAAGFAAAHQRFDRFRQSVVEGVGVQFAVESPAFVVAAAGKKPPYRNRLPAIEISRLVEMPRIALVRQHGVEVLLSACFFVDVNGVGTVGIDRRYEEKRRLVREKCDFIASIPMKGDIDSLNASVAAGVLAYEIVRQRMM